MQYIITENGQKVEELNGKTEFVGWYIGEFGYGCGNPGSIADNLTVSSSTYLGRGFTVTTQKYNSEADELLFELELALDGTPWHPGVQISTGCQHKKKYLNKISANLQFWVCPDCKQEI
jgi:hypothetical protein